MGMKKNQKERVAEEVKSSLEKRKLFLTYDDEVKT